MLPVHSALITFQTRCLLSKYYLINYLRDMLCGEKAIPDVEQVSYCFWSRTADSLSFHNMWLPVPLLSFLEKGKPQDWTISLVLRESI